MTDHPLFQFSSNFSDVNRAVRIMFADLIGNIQPFQAGLLTQPEWVILAGLDYGRPWTRDAAINTWNGMGLLFPEVAKNTLISTLEMEDGEVQIGGQYWDAIIWSIGAWWFYLYTGDKDFLKLAHQATINTLRYFENTEFNLQYGLFHGPACYGDGVSAYPERYAPDPHDSSILSWPALRPAVRSEFGYGIPMMALSTNLLYAEVYQLVDLMAQELGLGGHIDEYEKSLLLQEAINGQLWNDERKQFDYFIDPAGRCHHQESLGLSLALLFKMVSPEQEEAILSNTVVTEMGIPCVWPTFERYESPDGNSFGRHSGCIWPHIQGFWGTAAARLRQPELLYHEFDQMTRFVNRDGQFAELYHPLTGEIYGGVQEGGEPFVSGPLGRWASCMRQSWSASAYLRMLLHGIIGMQFEVDGIHFAPNLYHWLENVQFKGIPYRDQVLDIHVYGSGSMIRSFKINGEIIEDPFLPAEGNGHQSIEIYMMK